MIDKEMLLLSRMIKNFHGVKLLLNFNQIFIIFAI